MHACSEARVRKVASAECKYTPSRTKRTEAVSLLSLCIPGAFGIPGYPWPWGGHVASSVCSYISEHLYQQWKGG